MSRSNRKGGVRRRADLTGETYQQACREIALLVDRRTLIPDTRDAAQVWVESAVLHRLLHGARPHWPGAAQPEYPLFIQAVIPSATGLRMVVPRGQVAAFAASLVMRRDADTARPPADTMAIRYANRNGALWLTTPGTATGLVTVQCSWRDLRGAIDTDPYVSASSGTGLSLDGAAAPRLTRAERAVLSGLLRRIALFAEPFALDWLFTWHEWTVTGRRGRRPHPPAGLVSALTDRTVGLPRAVLKATGIDELRHSPWLWPAPGRILSAPELDWPADPDQGWRAAQRDDTMSASFETASFETASFETASFETASGLPRRARLANLVPYSPLRDDRPMRIVRDAASIAANTRSYFLGSRRGWTEATELMVARYRERAGSAPAR